MFTLHQIFSPTIQCMVMKPPVWYRQTAHPCLKKNVKLKTYSLIKLGRTPKLSHRRGRWPKGCWANVGSQRGADGSADVGPTLVLRRNAIWEYGESGVPKIQGENTGCPYPCSIGPKLLHSLVDFNEKMK